MITTRKTLLGTAIAVALTPIAAQGAGFGLNSHSAKSGGTSHAGTAVMAEDPATVYYNPAGMVLNEKAAISGSAAYIMPEFEFTDGGSATSNGNAYPGTNSTSDESGLAPSLYYMTPFRDDWALGLAINAPYGSSTKFEKDWIGRYNGTKSDIRGINFNPNIAHRINDWASIGFGINIQYFDASLTNMIPAGAVAASQNPSLLAPNGPINPTRLYSGDYDIESEVEGDSWGTGYNFGLLFQPSNSTRVGLAYRSEVSQDIDGNVRFTPQTPQASVLAQNPAFSDQAATTSIELPANTTLSISQSMGENDQLTVLADIQYTQWSSVDTIRIRNKATNNELSSLPLDFQNSWRGSIGAAWEQTEQLTLRAGYTFEESAVKNAETRTPRVPDNNRNWVSIGAGYKLANGIELDASYSHLFIKDSGINNDSGYRTTLNGEFESSADILSVQATYRY